MSAIFLWMILKDFFQRKWPFNHIHSENFAIWNKPFYHAVSKTKFFRFDSFLKIWVFDTRLAVN